MRFACKLITGLFLILLTALPGLAQTSAGSITGTVTDPNGAVVPGASVQLRHGETGTVIDASTTEAGIYLFPSAPVGPCSLTVSFTGFKQTVRSNLEVRVGSRITVDVRLEIGETQQSIEVSTEAPLLETTSPQRGHQPVTAVHEQAAAIFKRHPQCRELRRLHARRELGGE